MSLARVSQQNQPLTKTKGDYPLGNARGKPSKRGVHRHLLRPRSPRRWACVRACGRAPSSRCARSAAADANQAVGASLPRRVHATRVSARTEGQRARCRSPAADRAGAATRAGARAASTTRCCDCVGTSLLLCSPLLVRVACSNRALVASGGLTIPRCCVVVSAQTETLTAAQDAACRALPATRGGQQRRGPIQRPSSWRSACRSHRDPHHLPRCAHAPPVPGHTARSMRCLWVGTRLRQRATPRGEAD